jgi:hypothetical protein
MAELCIDKALVPSLFPAFLCFPCGKETCPISEGKSYLPKSALILQRLRDLARGISPRAAGESCSWVGAVAA